MNWIKDHLIAILGVALLVVLILAGSFFAAWRIEKAEHAATNERFTALEEANRSNYTNLVDMTERFNALVESNRLNQKNAAEAAGRAARAAEETAQAQNEARAARAAAARANAELAAYLKSGMPADLACLRWPESCR